MKLSDLKSGDRIQDRDVRISPPRQESLAGLEER